MNVVSVGGGQGFVLSPFGSGLWVVMIMMNGELVLKLCVSLQSGTNETNMTNMTNKERLDKWFCLRLMVRLNGAVVYRPPLRRWCQ